MNIVKNFKDKFESIVNKYEPKDVFNADKMGFF